MREHVYSSFLDIAFPIVKDCPAVCLDFNFLGMASVA